jgi:hypothetical protein
MTTINLINWTIREAQHPNSEDLLIKEADDIIIPSLDPAFTSPFAISSSSDQQPHEQTDEEAAFETEIGSAWRAEQARIESTESKLPTSVQVVTSTPTEPQPVQPKNTPTSISLTSIQIVGAPTHSTVRQELKSLDLPRPPPFAPSSSAETQNTTPEQALLMAIKQSDWRTGTADRERAIALRWSLRDILARRLKLSPVSDDDLKTLITLGLIEMQDGQPALTQTGLDAIA